MSSLHPYAPAIDDTHEHDWSSAHSDFFIRNLEVCGVCGAVRPKSWPLAHVEAEEDPLHPGRVWFKVVQG